MMKTSQDSSLSRDNGVWRAASQGIPGDKGRLVGIRCGQDAF
jgi:hypothetical protein